MADSTTNLDQISASQAQKEVSANALFDAASPATAFGRRASQCAGLTWGYYGGRYQASGSPSSIITVANGTLILTASTTCYVRLAAAGVVEFVTSAPTGWPHSLVAAIALYEIVTGTATVTSYTDYRLCWVRF